MLEVLRHQHSLSYRFLDTLFFIDHFLFVKKYIFKPTTSSLFVGNSQSCFLTYVLSYFLSPFGLYYSLTSFIAVRFIPLYILQMPVSIHTAILEQLLAVGITFTLGKIQKTHWGLNPNLLRILRGQGTSVID